MNNVEPSTIDILQNCCKYKSPALILNADAGTVCHARFESLSREFLILDVPSDEKVDLLPRRCCISFSLRNDSCAFFTTVRECYRNPPPQNSYIVLEIPTEIVGVEARSAYRVPIGKKSDLYVQVTIEDGRSLSVTPIDLSMTGTLVEFAAADDPSLPIGSLAEVELQFRSEVVKINTEVRRRDGHRYGLFFQGVVSKKGINPPELFRSIVEILERELLQKRVR